MPEHPASDDRTPPNGDVHELSSNADRESPAPPATDTGLDRDSKAQAEQVRSIAVDRVGASMGRLPVELLGELDEALRLHLAL
jgi:mRNA interferase MazF